MCKFRPGSGFFSGFAREIEGKQGKTKETLGEIQEFQRLSFFFAIFFPETDDSRDGFWEEET